MGKMGRKKKSIVDQLSSNKKVKQTNKNKTDVDSKNILETMSNTNKLNKIDENTKTKLTDVVNFIENDILKNTEIIKTKDIIIETKIETKLETKIEPKIEPKIENKLKNK